MAHRIFKSLKCLLVVNIVMLSAAVVTPSLGSSLLTWSFSRDHLLPIFLFLFFFSFFYLGFVSFRLYQCWKIHRLAKLLEHFLRICRTCYMKRLRDYNGRDYIDRVFISGSPKILQEYFDFRIVAALQTSRRL